MPRDSIFGLMTVQTTINEPLVKGLISYLVKNRDVIIPASDTGKLTSARQLSASPINSIFTKAMQSGYDRQFAFARVKTDTADIPEVITFTHLSMDLMQLKGYNDPMYAVTQGMPFQDKIFLNTTQMTRSTGEVSDIGTFQGLVIRDLLSRSYFRSDRTWLTPELILQAARVYSMSLSAIIATFYQLQLNESKAVQTLLALYFLSRTLEGNDVKTVMINQVKRLGLMDVNTVKDVLGLVQDLKGNDFKALTLNDILQLMNSLKVERLRIDMRMLFSKTRTFGEDLFTSAIALEYPPYFVYLMLQSAGGRKIQLTQHLRQGGLMRDVTDFAAALEKSHSFAAPL